MRYVLCDHFTDSFPLHDYFVCVCVFFCGDKQQFLVYHFISFIIFFELFFFVVALRITIIIVIYQNLVCIYKILISIVYEHLNPTELHPLPHVKDIMVTNYVWIHGIPLNIDL